MPVPGLDAEFAARELGTGGVDNIVTNAERICAYESQRIALTNEAVLAGLQAQYALLRQEEHHLEERLQYAPPRGDLRRLRRKAIYCWLLVVLLTVAGFAFALLTFEPFRLGWKAWLYCGGIAALTPFLVDKLLDGPRMERVFKWLTAAAAIAAIAGLMLLAVIRGNLLAEEIQANTASAVIIDDAAPQAPPPENTFYDSTLTLLRVTLLLLAFAMELGAGLALHEAWRSAPDDSEDWKKLRADLVLVRQGMAAIARQATALRNEPDTFAARFWRDFYRGLLTNAARSAMTKLLLYAVASALLVPALARAQTPKRLNLVIALDLSRSVAVAGPDGKTEFQKNIDGVTRILAEAPAGARVTVIGITDHSFTEPYILLRARVPDDPGYFGERLNGARRQVLTAWRSRSEHLRPDRPQTDILGALELARQVFAIDPERSRERLVIFSDMREDAAELDLSDRARVPSYDALAAVCGPPPDLSGVQVFILGVDGPGKSMTFWRTLASFWREYFGQAGAALKSYSVRREMPEGADGEHY